MISEQDSNTNNDTCRDVYRRAPTLIVAGGRDFKDYEFMKSELDRLLFEENFCHQPEDYFFIKEYFIDLEYKFVKILSGMAEGADTLAIRYADERNLTKILFPANWKYNRRRAGFLRNDDMISIATHLIAFWDGKSHGTADIIELAKRKGILYKIVRYDTETMD